MKFVIVGAGAIGACLGGWLSEVYDDVYLIDRGEAANTLKEKGLTLYQQGRESAKKNIPVKVIDRLAEIKKPDVIAIAVRNYNLEAAVHSIKAEVSGSPVILGMQDGVVNQAMLPKNFSKVIFAVIEFNAWVDEPGVIGFQKKGPFVLGCENNTLLNELAALQRYMSAVAETVLTDRIRDAAYCRMITSIVSFYTALVDFKLRDTGSLPLFKKVLSNSMYEGIKILRDMGVEEYSAGDMPAWNKIKAAATLPDFISMGIFKNNIVNMVFSNTARDILRRKNSASEIDSLLGELIRLADLYDVPVPYNKALYKLCREEFARPDFKPLSEAEVWQAVRKETEALPRNG